MVRCLLSAFLGMLLVPASAAPAAENAVQFEEAVASVAIALGEAEGDALGDADGDALGNEVGSGVASDGGSVSPGSRHPVAPEFAFAVQS